MQQGLLWGYLERLSAAQTVPAFVEAVPFEQEPAPVRQRDEDVE